MKTVTATLSFCAVLMCTMPAWAANNQPWQHSIGDAGRHIQIADRDDGRHEYRRHDRDRDRDFDAGAAVFGLFNSIMNHDQDRYEDRRSYHRYSYPCTVYDPDVQEYVQGTCWR